MLEANLLSFLLFSSLEIIWELSLIKDDDLSVRDRLSSNF
jgi:hypothetical protein